MRRQQLDTAAGPLRSGTAGSSQNTATIATEPVSAAVSVGCRTAPPDTGCATDLSRRSSHGCTRHGLRREPRPGGRNAACLHPDTAVLEARNLCLRVQRRIGQEIRRRFVIAERHEHIALGHLRVGTGISDDRVAPGFQRDRIPRSYAQLLQILGTQVAHRVGFDGIEHP